MDAADLTEANVRAATRLGAPLKVYAGEISPFRVEVAKRIATRHAAGQLGDDPASAAVRARARTEVAREFFRKQHGRDPIDAREIAATIAKQSRPRTQTVAGYDLTFSPVKSVSSLWAVADPHVAAQIELAHQAAVRDALSFIERHALFSRQGRNGVRQVNVRGLVAVAFTHRDSRARDPDLHTHVAVANKVQTLDGRWLSIDGRVLFKATVAASETYNTALEQHLRDRLGVRFANRPDIDPGKRPIRELAAQFQRDHGRPPTPVEALQLAHQATLETRDAKHEPLSLAEQRTAWYTQAAETLGGPEAVEAMISRALSPTSAPSAAVDAEWVTVTAGRVLAAVEEHRSTWQSWHVRAEAQRHVRAAQIPTDKVEQLVEPVTVSWPIAVTESVVLVLGLAGMLAANAVLLRLAFAPLTALAARMTQVDLLNQPGRLRPQGAGRSPRWSRRSTTCWPGLEAERRDGTRRAVTAQEAERRRVATELHDEVGQTMTALLMQLERLQEGVADQWRDELRGVQEAVRVTVGEVGRIAQELRPEMLDHCSEEFWAEK